MATLDRLAHALSDPTRLRILDLLTGGRAFRCCSPRNPDEPEGICACDLLPHFDSMVPSKLAYHLKTLREVGLVCECQRGKWVYYTLNREVLSQLATLLGERFFLHCEKPG